MKICWFNQDRLGWVQGHEVLDITAVLEQLPAPAYPKFQGDHVIAHLATIAQKAPALLPSAQRFSVDAVRFESPVAQPGKVIGVPVNYQKHVEEALADVNTFTTRYTGSVTEQGLFLKANSSLNGPSQPVVIAMPERLTHHEIELGLVIGKTARNVSAQDALSYVAGYCVALDMTIRGPEDRSMRKSLDTYSVLGPWLVTADEIADPQNLELKLTVNGEVRQATNTSQMIMYIAEQIEWASKFYTLQPGDVIMTGTCEGVGPVVPGDKMHASIEQVGAMSVDVVGG